MAGVRVGNNVHVRDASAEGPSESAEKSKERNALRPIFAAGQERGGHRSERAWNHRAIFVAEIAANTPTDRQSHCDRDEIEEHAA